MSAPKKLQRLSPEDCLLIDAEQDGEWLSARLDPGEVLNIHCPGYSAALSHEDLYEDTGLWR